MSEGGHRIMADFAWGPAQGPSVFDAFRSTGIISGVVGLLPWNIGSGHPQKFRLQGLFACLHLAGIGAYFCWIIVQPPAFFVEVFQGTSSTYKYVTGALVISTVVDGVLYLLMMFKSKAICRILIDMNMVDSNMHSNVNSNVKLWSRILALISLSTSSSMVVLSVMDEMPITFQSIYCLWARFDLSLIAKNLESQLIFYSISIGKRLENVNLQIKSFCSKLQQMFPEKGMKIPMDYINMDQLSTLGQMFLKLNDVTQDLEKSFSSFLVIYYIKRLIVLIISLFFVVFECIPNHDIRTSWFGMLFMFLDMSVFIGVTLALGSIPVKSNGALEFLMRVKTCDLSFEHQCQIQALIQRMSGPPVQVAAANFFAINRGLMTSIVGALTTYFIVLAQFKTAE